MGFEQVNSKVVRAQVGPGREVLARRGAMLGYDGQVTFRPVSGGGAPGGMPGQLGGQLSGQLAGLGQMVGRAVTGESVPMMVAEGQGSVLYGFLGLHVTLVELTGDSLMVEADRLLAHDAQLQTSVEMIGQGGVRQAVRGAMTGQGLFTTRVTGQGSVGLLSHGGAVALQLSGETVGVDPQAYVGHVGALRVELSASVGMRDLIGRGSGEALQLHVSGHGTVYVQASERKFR